MAILAALAHLDTDQHALRIDVADPQHDNLAAAQTGATNVLRAVRSPFEHLTLSKEGPPEEPPA
jgi:hypothetical protein